MKLKDKKIELLAQVTERDNDPATRLPARVGLFPAAFRQGSVRGGDYKLQGRSAFHDQLQNRSDDRPCCTVQRRSVRYYPH